MSRKSPNSVSIEEKLENQNLKAVKPLTKAAAKPASVKARVKKVLPEPRKAEADKTTSGTATVIEVPSPIQTAEGDQTTSGTATVIEVPPPTQPEEAKVGDKKVLVAKGKKKQESKPKKETKNGNDNADNRKLVTKIKKKPISESKKEIKDDVEKADFTSNEDPSLMLGQRAYSTIITDPHSITEDDLLRVNTRSGLTALLRQKKIDLNRINNVLDYEEELKLLQIELLKLQRSIQEKSERVVIIFEGRDAAGKGGTIRRFVEHLNPRAMRVVALPVPTKEEVGQWYFQRYIKQLPNPGEMVFFDRSWYNRAVVEPVNGFCSKLQYKRFMLQVPEFEHMLFEEGINLIKFYFSISRKEQVKRFKARRENPLKQWKLSPLDAKAQSLWDDYTHYKEMMFSKSHTTTSPWMIVQANNKLKARIESIRYVISSLEYEGKGTSKVRMHPDPNIVSRYNRDSISIE